MKGLRKKVRAVKRIIQTGRCYAMNKMARVFIVGLFIIVWSCPLHAAGFQYVDFENFNDVTPPAFPANWAVENTNADANTWETRDIGGAAGSPCVRYLSHTTNPANDWFFSPAVTLSSGITYTVSFKTRVTSASFLHNLSVWRGAAQNSTGMTALIVSLPSITNTDARETSQTFTVGSTGAYYIGFHCASVPNSLGIFMDDYGISRTESGLSVSLQMDKTVYQGLNTFSPTEEKKCLVYIKNNGASPVTMNTLMTIGDTNDPYASLCFIVKDPGGNIVPYKARNKRAGPESSDFTSLAPGNVLSKYYDLNSGVFKFSQTGNYTIQAVYQNFHPSTPMPWRGVIRSDAAVTIKVE